MFAVPHLVRTNQNPMIWTEASALPNHRPIFGPPRRTPPALHILGVQITVQLLYILLHENDHGRIFEAIIPPLLTPRTVPRLILNIRRFSELFLPFTSHLARQDVPVVRPLLIRIISGFRRVVRTVQRRFRGVGRHSEGAGIRKGGICEDEA